MKTHGSDFQLIMQHLLILVTQLKSEQKPFRLLGAYSPTLCLNTPSLHSRSTPRDRSGTPILILFREWQEMVIDLSEFYSEADGRGYTNEAGSRNGLSCGTSQRHRLPLQQRLSRYLPKQLFLHYQEKGGLALCWHQYEPENQPRPANCRLCHL